MGHYSYGKDCQWTEFLYYLIWVFKIICTLLISAFWPFCRFWIWKLLPARGASGHMVWQPALRCSRSFWRTAVWGPATGHLGKMTDYVKRRHYLFIVYQSYVAIQEVETPPPFVCFQIHVCLMDFSPVISVLCVCILFLEYGGSAVCAGVWCIALWWAHSSCAATESPRRKVSHPLLHDWRWEEAASLILDLKYKLR